MTQQHGYGMASSSSSSGGGGAALPQGVVLLAPIPEPARPILIPQALQFVATLHRLFNPTRKQLLLQRQMRQQRFDQGELPDFLPETKAVRDDLAWKGPKPGPGLTDRRVEITGPVDRKLVINALNAGASTFMADLEDSTSPTWSNVTVGQANLKDAIHRTITYTHPSTGREYRLRPTPTSSSSVAAAVAAGALVPGSSTTTSSSLASMTTPSGLTSAISKLVGSDGQHPNEAPHPHLRGDGISTLLVRPRGWHMEEKHVLIDGEPCSASLFDFGLYFFHCAWKSVEIGHGPYFYLPKLEAHREARLWNDVFNVAQDAIGMARGTVRATVLIETLPAAFEMDEILYELRDHSAGLNCGRWDYIFSYIKKLRYHPKFVLPGRAEVTMTVPFMDAYVRLLIQTCHRRGVHAMGGMAAQIPIKDDPAAHHEALAKVRADKLREVQAGHDGTWVAHPDLVPVAREVFDAHMPGPHQMYVRREDVHVTAVDLLDPSPTPRTERGAGGGGAGHGASSMASGTDKTFRFRPVSEKDVRTNLGVALQYTEAWLRGSGCVPIHHLMEDAATAEIARSQVWQWVRHGTRTVEGHDVTAAYVTHLLDDEANLYLMELTKKGGAAVTKSHQIDVAKRYLQAMIQGQAFPEFLTTLCYDSITSVEGAQGSAFGGGGGRGKSNL